MEEPTGPPETETLEQLARRYVALRTVQHRFTGSTAQTIRYGLAGLCQSAGPIPAADLRRAHIEEWLASLAEWAPATGRARLSQVKGFCRWLVLEGVLTSDPTAEVLPPRSRRAVPRALPAESVARLLDVCPDSRARFIVTAMVQLGLRCVEVAGLRIEDIETDAVRITGKGGHQRILPMLPDVQEALDAYLADHPAEAGPVVRNVYTGPRNGQAMDPAHVSTLVSKWMREAGIKGRPYDGVSAHALRHTAATDALRAGAHLRDVQRALGHVSLSTTERYLGLEVDGLLKALGGRQYGPPKPPPEEPAPEDLMVGNFPTSKVQPTEPAGPVPGPSVPQLDAIGPLIDEVARLSAEVAELRNARHATRTYPQPELLPEPLPICDECGEERHRWDRHAHCPDCGSKHSEWNLWRHQLAKHGPGPAPVPAACDEWAQPHRHTITGVCVCPDCQKPIPYRFWRHMRRLHEQCPDCARVFADLASHRRRAHPWVKL